MRLGWLVPVLSLLSGLALSCGGESNSLLDDGPQADDEGPGGPHSDDDEADSDDDVSGDSTSDDDSTSGPDQPDDDVSDSDDDDAVADDTQDDHQLTTDVVSSCEEPQLGPPVLRLLTRHELNNTLQDVFPEVAGQWTNTLPASSVSEFGFDNEASAVAGSQLTEALLQTAESLATAVAGSALSNILPCSTQAADQACARQYLEEYGMRLFRRPLTTTEADRYLALFDSAVAKLDFAGGIKWMTAALIQSPNAVYRSELGQPGDAGTRELTPFELATAMAYTFTGSTPSPELLDKARQGSLGDLRSLARDLLNSEAGQQALHRFFEAYVGYSRVASTQKPGAQTDQTTFDDVSSDMAAETRAFIQHVLYDEGGDLALLLTDGSTYPSTALANYYEMTPPASDYAEAPRTSGIGLLAQGSFLATHANSDASSPTQRGVFVATRLLCRPKPELPDQVPQLGAPEPGVRTTRQRYEDLHAAAPTCAGCHAQFDPLGYAFEHFDQSGRYRADENGLTIDASGEFPLPSGASVSFDGQEALMTTLAGELSVHECFAAYLATYAFGTAEACLGSSQSAALHDGEIGIVDAFAALASEPHFSRRAMP